MNKLALSVFLAVAAASSAAEEKQKCPVVCTTEYAPVCGSDGKTYPNKCNFTTAACLAANEGKDEITMSSEGPCSGDSKKCMKRCTKELEPLCGSDGITYNNKCLFEIGQCLNADLTVKATGTCKEAPAKPPSTKPATRPRHVTCRKGVDCTAKLGGTAKDWACVGPRSKCINRGCKLDKQWQIVACEVKCAVELKTPKGHCVPAALVPKVPKPTVEAPAATEPAEAPVETAPVEVEEAAETQAADEQLPAATQPATTPAAASSAAAPTTAPAVAATTPAAAAATGPAAVAATTAAAGPAATTAADAVAVQAAVSQVADTVASIGGGQNSRSFESAPASEGAQAAHIVSEALHKMASGQ